MSNSTKIHVDDGVFTAQCRQSDFASEDRKCKHVLAVDIMRVSNLVAFGVDGTMEDEWENDTTVYVIRDYDSKDEYPWYLWCEEHGPEWEVWQFGGE